MCVYRLRKKKRRKKKKKKKKHNSHNTCLLRVNETLLSQARDRHLLSYTAPLTFSFGSAQK